VPASCTVGLVRGKEALDILPDMLKLAAQPWKAVGDLHMIQNTLEALDVLGGCVHCYGPVVDMN